MRQLIFYVGCLLTLSGCINYAGIHGHSQALDANALSQPYHSKPLTHTSSNEWWNSFHDPQLNALIALALQDSPTMQMAENRVREACHVAEATNALRFPSMDLNGYYTRERFSQFGLIPPPFNDKTFNVSDIALNFNYEFDFWGKNKQQLAASLRTVAATQADFLAARLVLASAVAMSYFQLQRDLAQLSIANAIIKQQRALYQLTAHLSLRGIQSDIVVKSAEVDVASAKIAAQQYRQAALLTQHQLALLVGKNPLTMSMTPSPFMYHPHARPFAAFLPANLLANRPDIIAARARMEAAAHEINVAKARFFPNINLSLLFSYQSIYFRQLFAPGSQNNAVTAAIDLPLFDANRRRATLAVNDARYDLAVNTYNQTILSALQQVADQEATLTTLATQLASENIALRAIQANYKLQLSRYNHGITDYTQVLTMQGFVLQQQAIQLDLQAHELQAQVAMIKALGGYPLTGQG